MKKFSALFIALLMGITANSQDIKGSWLGELPLGPNKLKIVFNIDKNNEGAYTCTLDSPDQGVKGIATTISVTSTDSVKIFIPMIKASFDGNVKDKQIDGIFSQSGMKFNLTLKQVEGKAVINRPQTPQPPFEYTTEEVYFTNKTDSATLCGTLTYPKGFDKMKKNSVPVVLMVSGSGQQNRDEEIMDHKPFLVIADFLAKNGIASLRYDDRGMGKSKGNVKNATSFNNMKDALAGVEYLKQTGKFGKIGVLGHSEGGCIAFMIGAQKKADFIISMAGGGVRGDSIIVEQNRVMLQQSGMPQSACNDYCNVLKEIYSYKIKNQNIENPEEFLNNIIANTKANLPAPAQKNLLDIINSKNVWLQYFISYDPSSNISNTKCPTMAINGSKDTQVIAKSNLNAIKTLLPANKQNMIKEYPNLNHLFQNCSTGSAMEYAKIEETISPEVLQDISSWINNLK